MKIIIWVALSWLIMLTTVQAASFDCEKASSVIEKIICESTKLSALDEDLDRVYKAVQSKSTHEEMQRLISDQRRWLKDTRNACDDEPCLMQAYSSRIEAIKPNTDKNAPPLVKTDTLEKLTAPVGKGFPEDIRQINGNLVYSHYDDNGNTRSIVDFDFTTGRWSNLVQEKKDPKLIAQNSKYIVFHTPHSASFPIEVVDRKTGVHLSQIKLSRGVQNAFIEGDRLLLFQGRTTEGFKQVVSTFELPMSIGIEK